MPVQTFDFIINSRLGPTSLADIKEYNNQLERMIELQRASGAAFSPGTGGGGGSGTGGTGGTGGGTGTGGGGTGGTGGGGGGGGSGTGGTSAGSNSHNHNSAFSAGLGRSRLNGFDPIESAFNAATAEETPEKDATKINGMTNEQRHARQLKDWQRIVGIQALGYGMEDLYYSGFRGMMNNLPFMAQGLSSLAGFGGHTAQGIAGITALASTAGIVAYENRKPISEFLGVDLGSRAESVFGLQERSRAERLQEEASNSAYYIEKYGRESALGRSYMASSAKSLADAQRSSGSDVSNMDLAGQINALSPSERAYGKNVRDLGMGDEYMASHLRNKYKATQDEVEAEAKKLHGESTYSEGPISNYLGPKKKFFPEQSDFTDDARSNLETAQGGTTANLISKALSGDPKAVKSLDDAIMGGQIGGNMRDTAAAASSIAKNLTPFDAHNIASLRASASNPFADTKAISDQIRGILDPYAPEGGVDNLMGPINEQLGQSKKEAPQSWQRTFAKNQDRYVANIAASFGGIAASGTGGRLQDNQKNNLKAMIVQDLIASGVPANRARQIADQLYTQGYAKFNEAMDASNNNNGFSNLENFVMMLGDEQQMAFSQFQQNRMMIQTQQAALRRNAWMRSRSGLRGGR